MQKIGVWVDEKVNRYQGGFFTTEIHGVKHGVA